MEYIQNIWYSSINVLQTISYLRYGLCYAVQKSKKDTNKIPIEKF